MADPFAVLILGGTTEAAELARRLAPDPAVTVTSSLAGRTREPAPLPGEYRIGGFGGAEGLAAYLRESGTGALIDATHAFAEKISTHAAEACAGLDLPRLRLERPPWVATAEDDWRSVEDLEAAARAVAATGARRVFLSIGRQELEAFSTIPGIHFLVRMIDRPEGPPPLSDCEIVLGRGPFEIAEEIALLQAHGIDLLVTKNSGGDATVAKLDAARALKLPVVMISRPAPTPGDRAATVEEALAWIARRQRACQLEIAT